MHTHYENTQIKYIYIYIYIYYIILKTDLDNKINII